MHIKWPNAFALALLVAALVILLKFSDELRGTVSTLPAIGPGHSTEDRTIGLLVLGLFGIVAVAVTRILTARQPPSK